MGIVAIVIVGLALLAGGWLIACYNNLVMLSQRVKNAFSQIDVQLKRRYDLIPNLVESAKGYMAHERDTLTAVIQARNQAATARDAAATNATSGAAIGALASAEAQLSGALSKFFALSESYPDLKANQNISGLMEELSSTENKVGFSRQAFNDAVTKFNIAVQSFPTNLFAKRFGFSEVPLLEATKGEQEREAPRVAFN
jgi:LemA protein